jgi:MYND finger
LEIFNAEILDKESVHIFESLPGLKPPKATTAQSTSPEFALETDTFILHFPRFNIERLEFNQLVVYKAKKQFKEKTRVKVTHISPCTALVACAGKQQVCTFPFPVAEVRYEVVPQLASIKITAPLITKSNRGLYKTTPFPLVRLSNSKYSNWSLPYINFSKLDKFDVFGENTIWYNGHLLSMFSDSELAHRGTKLDPMTDFKNSIHAILCYINPTIRLKLPNDGIPIIFMVTGLYHDFNSHSIVADAYVFPQLNSKNTSTTDITITEAEMNIWRSALPAMAERCRNWEHTTTCEYNSDTRHSETSWLCSCGVGKVGEDFLKLDGGPRLRQYVTRVAISPIFVAPYVERTRGFVNSFNEKRLDKFAMFRHMLPVTDDVDITKDASRCIVCSKENAKKCAKCMQVAYCSRGCQAQDWKQHKKYCKQAGTKR